MQPFYVVIARILDCSQFNLTETYSHDLIIASSKNLNDLKKRYADFKQKATFDEFHSESLELQIARIAPITDFEVIKEPLVRVEYLHYITNATKPKKKFKLVNRFLFPPDLNSEEAIQSAEDFVAAWEEEAQEKDPETTFKFVGFKISDK